MSEYEKEVLKMMGEENKELFDKNIQFAKAGKLMHYPVSYTANFIMEEIGDTDVK